ncbi:MAG: PAS domain-containing protein, partial [Desulfuromonadaceae bacterium]
RYFDLYDLAPMGYLTFNARGLIYEANLSAATMLGVTRKDLFKNLIAQSLFHEDSDIYYLHRKRLLETGEVQAWDMRLMRADGSVFWAHLQSTPAHNGEYWIVFSDISERRKIDEVQSYLLQMGSNPSSEDFFESLASYLAKTLNMDYVCIDRLQGDCLAARTLAVYHDGRFEDNVEYTLKDTPCGDVVGKEICVFPRGVCSLFPQDPALQDLQAESYVGTTLWSFDMKPIGLIAVIGRKELANSHFAETVLKLVSIRAAAELERIRRGFQAGD